MNGPFGPPVTTNKANERTFERRLIPPGLLLYGVIADAKFRIAKKSEKSEHPGLPFQVWNLTFQVLGGDYAKQRIWDDTFVEIEYNEDMGIWTPNPYGSFSKACKLMQALGYPVEVLENDELRTAWLPPSEAFFKELCAGTGVYLNGAPLVGTLIGVKSGTRKRKKQVKGEDGKWTDVNGPDGKPLYEEVNTVAEFFKPTEPVVEELKEALTSWRLANAEPSKDDDIPF